MFVEVVLCEEVSDDALRGTKGPLSTIVLEITELFPRFGDVDYGNSSTRISIGYYEHFRSQYVSLSRSQPFAVQESVYSPSESICR